MKYITDENASDQHLDLVLEDVVDPALDLLIDALQEAGVPELNADGMTRLWDRFVTRLRAGIAAAHAYEESSGKYRALGVPPWIVHAACDLGLYEPNGTNA